MKIHILKFLISVTLNNITTYSTILSYLSKLKLIQTTFIFNVSNDPLKPKNKQLVLVGFLDLSLFEILSSIFEILSNNKKKVGIFFFFKKKVGIFFFFLKI